MSPRDAIEGIRQTAVTDTGLEGACPDVIHEGTEIGEIVGGAAEDAATQDRHRTPMPLATMPRSTSLVPPRSVNIGACRPATSMRSATAARPGASVST